MPQPSPRHEIAHLGHVELLTPEPEKSLDFARGARPRHRLGRRRHRDRRHLPVPRPGRPRARDLLGDRALRPAGAPAARAEEPGAGLPGARRRRPASRPRQLPGPGGRGQRTVRLRRPRRPRDDRVVPHARHPAGRLSLSAGRQPRNHLVCNRLPTVIAAGVDRGAPARGHGRYQDCRRIVDGLGHCWGISMGRFGSAGSGVRRGVGEKFPPICSPARTATPC